MLSITTNIDLGAQSVTWTIKAGETDAEVDGLPCHAISGKVMDDHLRKALRSLGYQHVSCKILREALWADGDHVEYWHFGGAA